jgi:hypothetical protein
VFKLTNGSEVIAVAKGMRELRALARIDTRRVIRPCSRGEAIAHFRRGAPFSKVLETGANGSVTTQLVWHEDHESGWDNTEHDDMYVNGQHIDELADAYYTQ